ncbi:uncharacterized protein LOC144137004 [Haemaphysalis longicornis]
MKRTQAVDAAREMVFLGSTASCDESQTTVTIVLVATGAGAMPSPYYCTALKAESYKATFDLFKQSYPCCFGDARAPQAFMTDNSAAKKAALCATWTQGIQLPCHFHVAQAEWRWLQASRNHVSRDERQELIFAFQKDTAELLKQIQEEKWGQHSLASGNPYYATALGKMLEQIRKITKEP